MIDVKMTQEEIFELRSLENGIEESGGVDLADLKDTEDLVRLLDGYRRLGQLEMKEILIIESGQSADFARAEVTEERVMV